jgi:hypothetical protein
MSTTTLWVLLVWAMTGHGSFNPMAFGPFKSLAACESVVKAIRAREGWSKREMECISYEDIGRAG